MQPAQDWLPISIPQTYLMTTPVSGGSGYRPSHRTPALPSWAYPSPLASRRSSFRQGERETRPTRASVSSCWIGNQAKRLTNERHLTVATSRIDPLGPGGRGAVSSGRSLFSELNRPQAKTSALPLLSPVYPPERLPLWGLHLNYYMSHNDSKAYTLKPCEKEKEQSI